MTMARGRCVVALVVVVLVLCAAGSATASIVDGLRAHYEFEGTGQAVADSTSSPTLNGFLGTSSGNTSNDPTRVGGLVGNALDFTPGSAPDLVTLPASNQFVTGTSAPVTITAWINPDSIGSGAAANRIFTLYRDTGAASTTFSAYLGHSADGGATGKFGLALNVGGPFTTFGGNRTISTTDGWHHAAVTYSGMNATLYLDGQWDRTITKPYTTTSSGTARIGAFNATSAGFDGKIDDVGVWTRGLTAAEIHEIYSAGRDGTTLSDAASPPPAPLALYYKLDESAGTTAEDSSGNANRGTLTGGLNFSNDSVAGQFGRALDFDGSNDYINVANTSGLPTTGDDFTVTTWLKVGEWDDLNLVAAYNLNGIKWNIGTHTEDNGILTAGASFGSNQAFATDSSALPDDEFVHLAIVYTASAGVANMYIDGMPVSEVSNTAWTNSDDAGSFALGRRFNSLYSPHHFDGAMDEFAIFNRVLTEQEINAVMNYGVEGYYIPEPATATLLALGGLGLLVRRRRRK